MRKVGPHQRLGLRRRHAVAAHADLGCREPCWVEIPMHGNDAFSRLARAGRMSACLHPLSFARKTLRLWLRVRAHRGTNDFAQSACCRAAPTDRRRTSAAWPSRPRLLMSERRFSHNAISSPMTGCLRRASRGPLLDPQPRELGCFCCRVAFLQCLRQRFVMFRLGT